MRLGSDLFSGHIRIYRHDDAPLQNSCPLLYPQLKGYNEMAAVRIDLPCPHEDGIMKIMEIDNLSGQGTSLQAHLLSEIQAIGKKYIIEKIVMFGSRARGDYHEKSDIDLAVYVEADPQKRALISMDLDDLRSLLKVDVVFMRPEMDPVLRANIECEGVVIYE